MESSGETHLFQQAGQPGEGNFKLQMTGEGDDDPQSSEGVVKWVGKQRVQGVMEKRELVISKTGLKGRRSAGRSSYKQGSFSYNSYKLVGDVKVRGQPGLR